MSEELKKHVKQAQKLATTPVIPNHVYENLPEPLKSCCTKFDTSREKDVFLTSSLAIVSGCLPNLTGRYGKEWLYANIYVLIGAPPASGKGTMRYAKMLGEKVHERLMEVSSLKTDAIMPYSFEGIGVDAPERRMVLFIPANTSSPMFMQHLKDNGGFGIICEAEADTLVNSLKQDWGNFSDQLRTAFHHETISASRKTDRQYFEIKNPRLSLVITGTIEQIKNLVPSAENGLFSRNAFYLFSNRSGWKSSKPCPTCNSSSDFFLGKGDEVLGLACFYQDNPMEFTMCGHHWDAANQYFGEQLEEATENYGDEAAGLLARLGIIQFRVAMVLSALRNYNSETMSTTGIQCSDVDFQVSMELAKTYLKHGLLMLELLPKSIAAHYVNATEGFYNKLSGTFKRHEAIGIARGFSIPERSADRLLKRFLAEGKLSQHSAGNYQKT